MSRLIELTAVFDNKNEKTSEFAPSKVLVDVSAIQLVAEWQSTEPGGRRQDASNRVTKKLCEVTLHPSLVAFGAGDEMAQDQRQLLVQEPYSEVRNVIEGARGIIRIKPSE